MNRLAHRFSLALALNDDQWMAKRSKVHPSHKTRYRVMNWKSYHRALVERGHEGS